MMGKEFNAIAFEAKHDRDYQSSQFHWTLDK